MFRIKTKENRTYQWGRMIQNSPLASAHYLNGQLHNEQGPAVEYPEGTNLWYLKGKCLTYEEWSQKCLELKEK